MAAFSEKRKDQLVEQRQVAWKIRHITYLIEARASSHLAIPESTDEFFADVWDDVTRIEGLKERLINIGGPLALRAHSLLLVLDRQTNEVYGHLSDKKEDVLEQDDRTWLSERYSVAHAKAGLALELVAAEMITEFEEARISRDLVPLPKRSQEVYEIIEAANRKGQAITGTEIIDEMNTKAGEAGEDRPPLEQGTLTSNIIPLLKELRGVVSKRGAGYYIPGIYDPTLKT